MAKAPPPPDVLANIIIWGCGHAKVGMVVQKFHVCGLQPPPTSKKLSTPLVLYQFQSLKLIFMTH